MDEYTLDTCVALLDAEETKALADADVHFADHTAGKHACGDSCVPMQACLERARAMAAAREVLRGLRP